LQGKKKEAKVEPLSGSSTTYLLMKEGPAGCDLEIGGISEAEFAHEEEVMAITQALFDTPENVESHLRIGIVGVISGTRGEGFV
jgi:hypothetical protein